MPARRKKKKFICQWRKERKRRACAKVHSLNSKKCRKQFTYINVSKGEWKKILWKTMMEHRLYLLVIIQLERLTLTLRANLWKHWEFSSGLPCSWQNKQSLYSMTMDNILLCFIITSNIYFHFTALPSTTSWHFFPSFSLNSLVDIPMFSSCLLHFCRWVKVQTFTIGQ